MSDKLDLKKSDKPYYSGKALCWDRITLPKLSYLAVRGKGAPDGADYAKALERLYPVAYGVKFACKADGRDFVVPPLSTQWWAQDPAAFVQGRRDEWEWQAMIRMPDFVTEPMVRAAMEAKGVEGVSLVELEEGDCFQTLHIGPYSEEGPILAQLHDELMPAAGMSFGSPHHEVYLSDPRRVAPEKLKTLLRQPVVPK